MDQPCWDEADIDVIDAGGQPASVIKGGSVYDHEMSLHLYVADILMQQFLVHFQVDQEGNIANWTIPGKMVPGMGGVPWICVPE